MTCHLDRRLGVVAASVLYALAFAVVATAQEANMSTTVASLGSGTVASRISFNAVKPRPATDRGLALPVLTLIDDGSGPRVTSLVLELPVLDLEEASIASRLGDQSLPAVFRAGPLAGSALASPIRGLTFTTTGAAPLSLSVGQMGTGTRAPGSPALAGAAVSLSPSTRLSLTPHVLIPGGSPEAQRTVGTAIQANVAGNIALVTDVGMAGTAATPWAPLASARIVGRWARAGIETSVLRGGATPRAGADEPFVSPRDREAVQAQVQPLAGLTLAALTSSSRPAADPGADGTTQGSLRIAYDGLPTGQLAAVRQRETTAAREADVTSLEWRHRALGRLAVRYVHRHESDSALEGADEASSRVEVDLPALAPRRAGRLNLRAALTAGTSSEADTSVNSRVSGRLGLLDEAVLTGETELGLAGGDGRMLRALRVTTEMPVVPATRLQLSYSYRAGAQFRLGQMFEARILRRLRVGW
jgi:hypothetical protein